MRRALVVRLFWKKDRSAPQTRWGTWTRRRCGAARFARYAGGLISSAAHAPRSCCASVLEKGPLSAADPLGNSDTPTVRRGALRAVRGWLDFFLGACAALLLCVCFGKRTAQRRRPAGELGHADGAARRASRGTRVA